MNAHPTARARQLLAAAVLALSSVASLAQGLVAPADAGAPADAALPFPVAPGGLLADPELSRRAADFELEAPAVTRGGAGGADTERLFATRCRSVVLILAKKGSGKEARLGSGTGSIVQADGLVLTAAHVVAGADQLIVGVFPNCRPGAAPEQYLASVVRVDQVADLALLRMAKVPADPVVMPLGRLDEVRTGSTVIMIGHPKGLLMSMSQGLVSAIRPDFRFSGEGEPEQRATVIQTDGALNPGNSGGPMMSGDGNLIGVNSFILGQASAGLNFAISINDVRSFLSRPDSRMAARPVPVQAAEPAKKECEPKVLKEWTEEGVRNRLLDLTCSGRANGRLLIPDDPSRRPLLLWDRNGDGKADVRYFLGRNNRPEISEWDDDFDGTFDYRAEHDDGEWEPKAKVRIASR